MKFTTKDPYSYIPLSERIAKGQNHPDNPNKPEQTKKFEIKTTHTNPRNELSKVGMSNIFTGLKQSDLNKNTFLKDISESKITENTMTIKIPIKQIITESLTDAIQRNASKISGGLLVGTGAAAAHALGGGDFNFGGEDNDPRPNASTKWDSMSDHEKDIAKNAYRTEQHDYTKPKGYLHNFTGAMNSFVDNVKGENKLMDMKEKHNAYMDSVNSDGEFLSTGAKLGLGAAGAGAVGLGALKARSKIPGVKRKG